MNQHPMQRAGFLMADLRSPAGVSRRLKVKSYLAKTIQTKRIIAEKPLPGKRFLSVAALACVTRLHRMRIALPTSR
jgi:hypothetical protein